MKTTIKTFFDKFPDNDACLAHLFEVRFGRRHSCPNCGKPAKWYRIEGRPVFASQCCRHHIHPMAGTLFEDSHTSLQSWFFAIFLFTTTRNGVSAKELQRQLGVTYKTAWRMGHQIRKHMDKVNGGGMLSGVLEVDEAMIGGRQSGKTGRGAAGKTLLLGMVERAGNVMVKTVPDARNQTLHPIIHQNVTQGSEIHTDMWHGYKSLKQQGYTHKAVKHRAGVYAKDGVHVNTLEGYWSHLQRAISSTHVFVSGKYLEQYAAEFSFRFNLRKSPEEMFPALLSSFSSLK